MSRSSNPKRSGWAHPVSADRNHRRWKLKRRAASRLHRLRVREHLDRLAVSEAREIA